MAMVVRDVAGYRSNNAAKDFVAQHSLDRRSKSNLSFDAQMATCSSFVETIRDLGTASLRRKKIDLASLETSSLKRCLSTWELTLFGVGATIGPGLYIISGQVARETAGPGVVASYAIAALACLFSAVCYAEFAVRLPRSGSSYTYCYATVGEVIGFIVGWNVIFENIVGYSVVAKAWSQYLDSFVNNTIQSHLEQQIFANEKPVYFDVLAFGLVLVFTVVVSVGAHITSSANVAFTAINMFVCILIVIIGSFYINPRNWNDFAPFGISGIIKGAGKCFYAMLGFDCVATTCEETEDKRTVLYFFTAAVLTLIVPWNQLDVNAAFPMAFDMLGAHWAKYVIAIGAMCSLIASILGGLYSASRVTYSMAHDGLLFRFLGWVPELLRTPVLATIVVGIIGALMALIFNLIDLVEMMSIGTLMAYSAVSASVLILRYQPWTLGFVDDGSDSVIKSSQSEPENHQAHQQLSLNNDLDEKQPILDGHNEGNAGAGIYDDNNNKANYNSISTPSGDNSSEAKKADSHLTRLSNCILSRWETFIGTSNWQPNERTGRWATRLTATYCCAIIVTAIFAIHASSYISAGSTWALVLLSFFIVCVLANAACFYVLPRNPTKLHFKVPGVPTWCLVSLALNLSIMMTLSIISWIRVAVWLAVGLAIYFGYGVRHSSENAVITDGDSQELTKNMDEATTSVDNNRDDTNEMTAITHRK